MNVFADILARFSELCYWFYIVLPWEQALHIRAGKNVTKIGPGLYFKFPFVDIVYKQNTRIRAVGLESQTVTTTDGATITFSGSIRYRVVDIEKMYSNVHNVQDTVRQEVQGIITRYFRTHASNRCSQELIQKYTSDSLDFDNFGFSDVEFFLKDFASVKTYRFITGPCESDYFTDVDMGESKLGANSQQV